MRSLGSRLVAGFTAGALAAAVFHQGMFAAFVATGGTMPGTAWNLTLTQWNSHRDHLDADAAKAHQQLMDQTDTDTD